MIPTEYPHNVGTIVGTILKNAGIGTRINRTGEKMLTDIQIRRAKAGDKPYKITDSGGLHLYVSAAGGKYFRMRYRMGGKEKILSIGQYPETSLADARTARDEAKALLKEGIDPSKVKRKKRIAQQTNTFETVAREWHGTVKGQWSQRHAENVLHTLERDVFGEIGALPIQKITPAEVLDCVRQIETRGSLETAKRMRQRMSAVFVYGIATGVCETDPASIIRNAMAQGVSGRHPAVETIEEARQVMRDCEATPGHPVTKLALRILALTATRSQEVRFATWDELSGDMWLIPKGHMKKSIAHSVPLSRQAMEVFDALRSLTGNSDLMFPSSRNPFKPISENAMGYLLSRAGYDGVHVPHGWRATFSTVMNDLRPQDARPIDAMLAHKPKDKVEAAYNRAAYKDYRREIAQEWADLLMQNQLPIEDLLKLPRRAKIRR